MAINNSLSRRTIDRDLQRGEKFWGTLAREPEVFQVLQAESGYSVDIHQECWDLHLRLAAFPRERISSPRSLEQVNAIAQLDQYDGDAFSRTRSALRYLYPSQLTFIFKELRAGKGNQAISAVHTYLARINALKTGSVPERESTREADRAAIAMLEAQRIVHPERVAELREWLRIATQEAPQEPEPQKNIYDDPDFQAVAFRYHALLTNWRGQARAVIKRRDYLLRLGLVESTGGDSENLGDAPDLQSAVQKQLILRFGPLGEALTEQLALATPEELEDIAERLLTANSVEVALGLEE